MTDPFMLAVRLTTFSFRLALSAARGTGRILHSIYLRAQQKSGRGGGHSVPPPAGLWTLLGWLLLGGLVVLLSLLGSHG